MQDAFGNDQRGGGVFPFLSVLICTIGALTLILVAGSVKATIADPQLPQKLADARRAIEAAEPKIEETTDELDELKKSLGTISTDVGTASSRASELNVLAAEAKRDHARVELEHLRLAEKKDTITRTLANLESAEDDARLLIDNTRVMEKVVLAEADVTRLDTARGAAEAQIADMKAQIAQVTARITDTEARLADMKERVKNPDVEVVAAPGHDIVAARYIDLSDEGALLLSDDLILDAGKRVPRRMCAGPYGYFDALAAAFAKSKDGRYVAFLVRPGGSDLFRAAASSFGSHGAPYSHEAVENSWKVSLPAE